MKVRVVVVAAVMTANSSGCGAVTAKHVGASLIAAGSAMAVSTAAIEGYSLSQAGKQERPHSVDPAVWRTLVSGLDDGSWGIKTRMGIGVGIGVAAAIVGAMLMCLEPPRPGAKHNPSNVLSVPE